MPSGRFVGRSAKWFLLAAILVALVALVVGSTIFGLDWREDHPRYVGTSHRVTLNWTCWNLIFWKGHGFQWWAGQSPAPGGPLDTETPPPGPQPATHTAVGTLKFNSVHNATFTSDAGGRMTLRRESTRTPHTMECAVR